MQLYIAGGYEKGKPQTNVILSIALSSPSSGTKQDIESWKNMRIELLPDKSLEALDQVANER